MSGQWQAAIISWQSPSGRSGGTSLAFRVEHEYGKSHWQTPTLGQVADDTVTDARPLVVIDPEDAEAVERLWRAWTTLAPEHRLAQDNMQAALREFANPTPPRCEASVSIDTGDGFIGHWCRRDRGHAGPHESAAATWWDEVRP